MFSAPRIISSDHLSLKTLLARTFSTYNRDIKPYSWKPVAHFIAVIIELLDDMREYEAKPIAADLLTGSSTPQPSAVPTSQLPTHTEAKEEKSLTELPAAIPDLLLAVAALGEELVTQVTSHLFFEVENQTPASARYYDHLLRAYKTALLHPSPENIAKFAAYGEEDQTFIFPKLNSEAKETAEETKQRIFTVQKNHAAQPISGIVKMIAGGLGALAMVGITAVSTAIFIGVCILPTAAVGGGFTAFLLLLESALGISIGIVSANKCLSFAGKGYSLFGGTVPKAPVEAITNIVKNLEKTDIQTALKIYAKLK
jgi:hypothetical protein